MHWDCIGSSNDNDLLMLEVATLHGHNNLNFILLEPRARFLNYYSWVQTR